MNYNPRTRILPLVGFTLVSFTLVALMTAIAFAAAFLPLSLNERLQSAENAVLGNVTRLEVEVRSGEPWTLVTLSTERWWRLDGQRVSSGPESITLAFLGGNIADAPPLQVAGVPRFSIGERVILFFYAPDAGLVAPTVGGNQGVVRRLDGVWRADDGPTLGLADNGALALGGLLLSDDELLDALDDAFDALVGGNP